MVRFIPFKISSTIPLGRVGLSLCLLVLIGLGLTLGLRGAVKPITIAIVGSSNLPATNYGESVSGTTLGYSENFSDWVVHLDPSVAEAQLVHNSTLLQMQGSFVPTSNSASVRLIKNVNIDIASSPIFESQVDISKGVGYGIRFFATYPNGTRYNVWWEGSALDHRAGSGYEDIRVNMQRQALLATGHQVTRLSAIQIYLEVPANTETNFQLDLLSLDFVSQTLAPVGTGADLYRAIYLDLGNVSNYNTSWTLNRINVGVTLTATPGSTFSVYLVTPGAIFTSSTAQLIPYYPSTSSSEITFYPNRNVALFPELLPPWNNSIVLVAGNGYFETVHMNYANLVFLPPPADTPVLSPQSLGFYYSYFIFFLFVLPAGIAVLAWHQFFRLQSISRLWIGVVLAFGLLCRFAVAGVTAHVFDTTTYLASARAWFQYGNPSGSLGPTLPVTFLLYWMGYSPYALLQMLGFQDISFLGHQAGIAESIFIKMFPILSDTAVFLFLLRLKSDAKSFVWSAFYFLNPLSIFISSVWGQYEAATIALVVLGVYGLSRNRRASAGISFVVSGLLQLFGFIPYALLLLSTAWAKKWRTSAVLVGTLALVFAYPPETSLLFRLFSSFLGVTQGLAYGSPGKYTLIGSFNSLSFLSSLHPLLLSGTAIFTAVLYTNYLHRFNLNSVLLYSGLAVVSFLLFSGPVASWVWLLPLGLLYAVFKEKDSLAAMTLPFGTAIAFTIVSYLTGSAYFLLGTIGYPILPAIEGVRHGLEIFTITATFAALLFLYYLLRPNQASVGRTLLASSALILTVYLLAYFWVGVYVA